MPLPSQTARTSIGRATMYRRKRSSLRPVAGIGVGLGVIAVLVWGIAKFAFGGDDQPLAPQGASAQNPPAASPGRLLATDTQPNQPAEKPILELQQGRGPAAATGSTPASTPATFPQPAQAQPQPQPTKQVLGNTPGVPPGGEVMRPAPAAAPPPAPAPVPGLAGYSVPQDLMPALAAAKEKQAGGDPVMARVLYSRVLADRRVSEMDKGTLRSELTRINDELVFSPKVVKGDPFTDYYTVQSGDSLTKISQKLGLGPDRMLLKRVNRLASEHKINLGQKLKVVKGPFHAVVSKSAYRLDVYMGPAENRDQWVFVRSFRVGLGEDNGTPVGNFIVKKGSKLIDPPWINPRTGERFAGGDPTNPIGKRWIAIEGLGESAQHVGFGIHGTIDPGSIGQQRSMGCVRMLPEDVELMYELMGEGVSLVNIVP